MGIILRLQGVNVKAGPEDIRQFFEGFYIPDGGVYIIGGSLKEAFIAFGSEKDGQLAMRRSGNPLKGSMVTLHVSSVAELEHKLKLKLQGNSTALLLHPASTFVRPPIAATPPSPPVDTPLTDPKTNLFCNLLDVLHGLKSCHSQEHDEAVPSVQFPQACYTSEVGDLETPKKVLESEPGYVRLFGLPAHVTKDDISNFFQGLQVQEVITNVHLGINQGCLVKFTHLQDSYNALNFNNQWMGPTHVEVRGASEKMWISALQECKGLSGEKYVQPVPTTSQQKLVSCRISNQSPVTITKRKRNPNLRQSKTTFIDPVYSKLGKKPRSDCIYPTGLSKPISKYVMVKKLPKHITKTDIKELFGCQIPHNKIIHLQDSRGLRTDTAFIIFQQPEDYEYALNLNGCHVESQAIDVSSVSKEQMKDMLDSARDHQLWNSKKKHKRLEAPKQDVIKMTHACLYARNMPADVQKTHVQSFFRTFNLHDDSIFLMHDNDGNGLGEAVIEFKSAKLAAIAQRKHGRNLLGVNILLTFISAKQKADLLNRNLGKADTFI